MEDFHYFSLDVEKRTKGWLFSVVEKYLGNNYYKIICDHVTLLHTSQKEKYPGLYKVLSEMERKGVNDTFTITHIGVSDKCIAFKVESKFIHRFCANKIPHITYLVYEGGKPVDSNKIEKWIPIQRIILGGRLVKHT